MYELPIQTELFCSVFFLNQRLFLQKDQNGMCLRSAFLFCKDFQNNLISEFCFIVKLLTKQICIP